MVALEQTGIVVVAAAGMLVLLNGSHTIAGSKTLHILLTILLPQLIMFLCMNYILNNFFIYSPGEVVPVSEGKRRLMQYAAEGLKHTYIMDLSKNEVIDATKKGGIARFINHSCGPNCKTEKWQVSG